MSIKKIVGIVVSIVVMLFIAIQFVPVERTNPPVAQEPEWDSPQTRAFAQQACFDCHSNETKWPWYSNVAPVSWAIADHVIEGREHLNFSEYPWGETEETAEEVMEGEMPLWNYLLLHPEAQFTETETEAFVAGLQATFGEADQHDDDDDDHDH